MASAHAVDANSHPHAEQFGVPQAQQIVSGQHVASMSAIARTEQTSVAASFGTASSAQNRAKVVSAPDVLNSGGRSMSGLAAAAVQQPLYEDVIQAVEHPDQAAEPAIINDIMWAQAIQRRIDSKMSPLTDFALVPHNHLPALLLTFDRSSTLLHQCILQSQPARRAADCGVELQPAWAHGAIILVPDVVCPDIPGVLGNLGGSHVIVKSEDQAELLEALDPLPVRYKKLKPFEARAALPDIDSLFRVSSDRSSRIAHSSGASHSGMSVTGEIHFRMVPIRTFWELEVITSSGSGGSVATWP